MKVNVLATQLVSIGDSILKQWQHTAARLPPIKAWTESKANDRKLKRAILTGPRVQCGEEEGKEKEKRSEKK